MSPSVAPAGRSWSTIAKPTWLRKHASAGLARKRRNPMPTIDVWTPSGRRAVQLAACKPVHLGVDIAESAGGGSQTYRGVVVFDEAAEITPERFDLVLAYQKGKADAS